MTIRTIRIRCSCENSREIVIRTTRNHGVIRCAACGNLVGWKAENYTPPKSPWGKFVDWLKNSEGDLEVSQTYTE